MSLVHLTPEGDWRECEPALLACELPMHLPDTTVEMAEAMPLDVLLPLMEIVDPPQNAGGVKRWQRWDPQLREMLPHRYYGLPAIIWPGGDMEWWVNGTRHRGQDHPALIAQTTHGLVQEWYWEGERHRDGELPAIIDPMNGIEWWVHGKFAHS